MNMKQFYEDNRRRNAENGKLCDLCGEPSIAGWYVNKEEKTMFCDECGDLIHKAEAIKDNAGKAALEQVLEGEGGHVGAAEVSNILGITKQAVLKQYNVSRLLLGWRGARQQEVRFPVWQFDGNSPAGILFGLKDVLEIFNKFDYQDDLTRLHFFLKPRDTLDGNRPLDLLRKRDLKPVIQAAYNDAGP